MRQLFSQQVNPNYLSYRGLTALSDLLFLIVIRFKNGTENHGCFTCLSDKPVSAAASFTVVNPAFALFMLSKILCCFCVNVITPVFM